MNIKKVLAIGSLTVLISALPPVLIRLPHKMIYELNTTVGTAVLIIAGLVLLPLMVKYHKWLRKNSFENSNQEPVTLFVPGALSWLISIGMKSGSTLGIQFRDTYYVISYGSVIFFGVAFFGLCAIIYFVLSNTFDRDLNITISRIHFWVSFIGVYFLFWMIYFTGEVGEPRRYTEFSGWAGLHWQYDFNRLISITVTLVLVAQLFFFINIIYGLFNSRRGKHFKKPMP